MSDPRERSAVEKRRLLTELLRKKAERPRRHPLSLSQERLWFLEQLNPGTAAFNIPAGLRVSGSFDPHAAELSLNRIIQRHQILRTTFDSEKGEPYQLVHPALHLDISMEDLSRLPGEQKEQRVARHIKDVAQSLFDLKNGPLLRVRFLKSGERSWILLFAAHHIIADGWSMRVLLREMAALYPGYSQGRPSDLPALPLQYTDFAHWQRESIRGERMHEKLRYWSEQLEGAPVLELPADKPRPREQTYSGRQQSIFLSKTLSASIVRLAHDTGGTLYMTLVAAYAALLHRLSGQWDLLIGSPVANRTRVEFEPLIGFFVNYIVLRIRFTRDMTFADLLQQVHKTAIEAYDHQDAPFERVVERLEPRRSLSHSPLFQAAFVLHNEFTRSSSGEHAGLQAEYLDFDWRRSEFDLTLAVDPSSDALRCIWEYSTDLFEESTIKRIAAYFERLLEDATAEPNLHVADLRLLGDFERAELLSSPNDTRTQFEESRCIQELFTAQASRTPDGVAIAFDEQQLTYRELDQRSDQLAQELQAIGVGPEVPVGIMTEPSIEMVIGVLAVLKAGGAYLPLDPGYPRERLEFMLSDSGAAVLLRQEGLEHKLPNYQGRIVLLPKDGVRHSPHVVASCLVDVAIESPAYVIYTSGSTGTPKGVTGLHRNTVNRLRWMWNTYPFERDEVACQRTSLSFVDSVSEIFGPLLQGIRCIIVPTEARNDPRRLLRILADEYVSRILVVPSLLKVILDSGLTAGETLRNLRYCVSSGEMLSTKLCRDFYHHVPHSLLLNLYGSSEVAGDVTSQEAQESEAGMGVPLGRPVANTRLYIVDRRFEPAPFRVTGELQVGGIALARGYSNRPDLTAEKFIPDAFGGRPGERLYRTGDLVRYRSNFAIEFLGRSDQQIKVRGIRLEPGEIELALAQCEQVREAAVSAWESPEGTRLVAHVTPNEGVRVDVGTLRAFLAAKLPTYFVPQDFVVLNELPRTPSGKLNRGALSKPAETRPDLQHRYVAPRNATEVSLAGIWQEVLLREEIGIYDNFFELGGHSLLAARIFARVQQEFGVEVPLRGLFESPTIAGLAELIDGKPITATSPLVAIAPHGSCPPFFCVHPVHGAVLAYYNLSRHIGPSRPFYALEARGLHEKSPVYRSVEEMASDYIGAIREVQPEGPYYLGGWSAGGVIALAMAQGLEDSGAQVAGLTLIDSQAPSGGDEKAVLEEIRRGIEQLRQLGVAGEALEDFRYFESNDAIARILEQGHSAKQTLKNPRVLLALYLGSAVVRYRPRSYSGPALLLKATETPLTRDSSNGWATCLNRLEVRPVPGTHLSMMEPPHVEILARELAAFLQRL